jgi:hypothetical protein
MTTPSCATTDGRSTGRKQLERWLVVVLGVVVADELCGVVALKGLGEFLEKFDERGSCFVRQTDGEAQERQIVGFEHSR